MKKIKTTTFTTPRSRSKAILKGYLEEKPCGLLLSMHDIPFGYEIVVRKIKDKRHSQTIYQNI